MKILITFGAATLVLAAVATSCSTAGSRPGPKGGVYLVGVAGGG